MIPAFKRWLERNPRIHFHYTPTSASWVNQVEGFFGILAKQSLRVTDFPSKKALWMRPPDFASNIDGKPGA